MSEFLASPLFLTLLAFAATVVSIVGGGLLGKWLLTKKQGYPGEDEIEAALKPFVINAILAAYKVSEAQVDELGDRLQGVDKKMVAMLVYKLLPDVIPIPLAGGKVILIPIGWLKKFFTEDDFADMIENVFNELGDFLESTQGKFGKEVEELLKELE